MANRKRGEARPGQRSTSDVWTLAKLGSIGVPPKVPRPKKRPKCPQGCGPHPKHDGSVYINPDGKGQWWDHLADDIECPIVLEVWTNVNVWEQTDECDRAYDYVALVEKAFERIGEYIDTYTCPDACRFKEFYREPGVGLHIETSCSKLADGVVYTAHVKAYFACVETGA